MEGRSGNSGLPDARYKFLAKERDVETGIDWLEARGYDARTGRFLAVDPLADMLHLTPWSVYHYSFDNPMRFRDQSGTTPEDVQDPETVAKLLGKLVGRVLTFLMGDEMGPRPGEEKRDLDRKEEEKKKETERVKEELKKASERQESINPPDLPTEEAKPDKTKTRSDKSEKEKSKVPPKGSFPPKKDDEGIPKFK